MNIRIVPAYLEVDGKKVEIGTARVDIDSGCAEISIPESTSELIRPKIVSGVSFGGTLVEVEEF